MHKQHLTNLLTAAVVCATAVFLLPTYTAAQSAEDTVNTADSTRGEIRKELESYLDGNPFGDLTEPDDSKNQQKIQIAQTLMRQRNYMGAERLLEDIIEQEPDNPQVKHLLLTCYTELKHHLKAEALLEDFLLDQPRSFTYNLMLAEIQAQMGDQQKARASYAVTLYLVPPEDSSRFLQLLNSQVQYGLEDAALYLIDSMRTKLQDPTLFALPRAQIYEQQGKYAEAVDEYFPLLAEDTSRGSIEAERRIYAMLDFEGSAKETEKALMARSDSVSSGRAMRLLATHHIRQDDFETAFDFAIRQDSIDRMHGSALIYFMRQAREKKRYDQVLRMGDTLLTMYHDAPGMVDARFDYAEALEMTGQYDSAITIYQTIVQSAPGENDQAEALFRVGKVFADRLNDCERALAVYASVVSYHRRGFGYLKALREIPTCHLRLGELDEAESALDQIGGLRLQEEVAEEVAYRRGLIQFFRKDFDSTQMIFRKLMVDFPRGFYVNDALRIQMTLSEAGQDTSLMYDYSNALYFQTRRMPDSAQVRFEALVEAENTALAGVSLLTLAEMALSRPDTTAAMARVDRLLNDFPESYYVPFGVKLKADVLLKKPATYDQAVELYRHLLQAYPNFPQISEVRKIMRKINESTIG